MTPLFEPKSAMGEALRYMRNQWTRLTAFVRDLLIPLRNNASVNPEAYLTDVLLRIQDQPKSRLAELLPHRWKETFGSGFTVDRVITPRSGT